MNVNVRNRHSNTVLDTSIRYDKNDGRIQGRFESNLIEEINMRLDVIVALIGGINKMKNFIKPIIHINNRFFNL